jgi:SulP family sulfate permease
MAALDTVFPVVGKSRREGFCALLKDALVPGLTVGFMAVPQCIAYALLAGLPPIYGLYASTVGVFVYALIGTSAQLAVGPVALVSLLTKGVIDGELGDPETATEAQIVAIAVVLAFCVGAVQIVLGLVRAGGITSFLSHDVLAGFTASAAVIIAFSQMKYIFGIPVGRHHYPWETIADVFANLGQTNGSELAVSLSCLALLVAMKVWKKRHPAWTGADSAKPPCWFKTMTLLCSMSALVVVIIFTPVSAALHANGVALKIVGPQPGGFPVPSVPDFAIVFRSFVPVAYTADANASATTAAAAAAAALTNCSAAHSRQLAAAASSSGSSSSGAATDGNSGSTLLISAVVIALIGFMESYAVAVAVATDDDDGVNANQELVAIGLANVVGSFFSGLPIAGSFGRTAVAAKSGAKSTVAAAVTGCFVVISLLLLMPAFTYLPYAVLAAIIEVAVVGLVDVDAFVTSWKVSKPEFIITSATFVSVLALGIEMGVLLGAALSICFALRRAAIPNMVILGRVRDEVPHAGGTWRDTTRFRNTFTPRHTIIVRVDSAIFFANTSHIAQQCLKMAKDSDLSDKVVRNIEHRLEEGQKEDAAEEREDRPTMPDEWLAKTSKTEVEDDKEEEEEEEKGKEEEDTAINIQKRRSPEKKKRFILHLSSVDYIDLSGVHMLHSLDKALAARDFLLTLSYPRGPVRDMLQKANEVLQEHHHDRKSLGARTFDSINEAIAGARDAGRTGVAAAAAEAGTVQMVTIHTESEHGDNDGGVQDRNETITFVETQSLSASLGE